MAGKKRHDAMMVRAISMKQTNGIKATIQLHFNPESSAIEVDF